MNNLDVTKHGDRLEREFGDIINTSLGAYKTIWSLYIGNDGQSRMYSVPSLEEKENKKRKKFAQDHYSCFESIVGLKVLCDKVKSCKVSNMHDYVHINNDFMAFQAHAGRIRDTLKRCGELLGDNNLANKLNEYYQQRNNVLHGCKVPFSIVEGAICIPRIKGAEEDSTKWNDTMTWDDVDQNNIEFLDDFMNETYREIVYEVNTALSRLISTVKTLTEKLKIKLDVPSEINAQPDTSACVLLRKPSS